MKEPLNILMVATSLNYKIRGGLSRHTYELCRALSKLGCKVYVSCMNNAENSVMNIRNRILVPYISMPFLDFVSFNSNLLRKTQDYNIDIIHSQGDHGAVFALIKKKPFVVTVHGSMKIGLRVVPKNRHHISSYFRVLTEKITFRKADRIIVVSEFLRVSLQKDYGIEKQKITYIPNAVNVEKFNPNLNAEAVLKNYGLSRPLLLCVTRLEAGRFVEKLIPTMEKVTKEIPNVRLVIVGDGPLRYSIERLRNRRGLTKNILLVGSKDEELPLFYSAADLYILPVAYAPAIKEFTVLEAMASGKMVIYVNRNQPVDDEAKNSVNPILVENDEQFADAIIYYLQNGKKREVVGLTSRKWILKNLSWENVAEKTMDVYRSLL